ncbi:MAG TPA: flagellar filament capping protein FliD [Terracidiphilus sp.]|jgi:flagellar hook-associated protein 2|nr:flagellar filament capping protein FliD [Terracidiphilus sp.]
MATVGLSFGSPTSGSGFDVSTTVASIVSNLQNIETPWKNQLTSLQSQDTVLSSLGTLFSNLSNDLSQLTDFQGALAQKSGSSSNTNVLELTSASSTATAGTHTVTVGNLAQTSSGYLDPIGNSSDTLAGSIEVAVNGGNSQTFNLSDLSSGQQNLAGLAAAINSAGIGVSASVLTDSAGSRLSLVSGTSGAAGELTVSSALTDSKAVTSTNSTGALKYNDSVDGKDASLTVDGVSLTSASNTVANLIPGVTFQLLAPTASNSPVQVVIANYNSGVESAVSTMVSDYNSLVSAVNTQEGDDSSGKPEPLFGSPTISLLQQELLGSLNAVSPNGYLAPVENAADTLSGSISIQVGSGAAKTFTVDSSDSTLAGLASTINAANLGVTAKLRTTSAGTSLVFDSQQSGAGGKLSVTSSIVDVTSSNTELGYTSGSDISNLSALGINVNDDGTLTLDSSTLDSALNTDFSGVVSFFQDANGWGENFATVLNNAGSSSSSGVVKLAESSNSAVESDLNANITREESLISAQQKSLTAELNSANEILQQIPNQLSGVDEMYAAISGYNQNQNG